MRLSSQVLFWGLLSAVPLMGVILLSHASAERHFMVRPGDQEFSLMSGGMERHYVVHVPYSYNPGMPSPVILNFHGGGGNPKTQSTISMMNEASDRHGFIVVYPEGTGAKFRLFNAKGYSWNAGSCCGWAMKHGVDDVGYTYALLNDLERRFNVDKRRIFATGISNGAMMCHRLACEMSDRIAAIAPIAGSMGVSGYPSRPVSVIYFQGTADKFMPIGGGKGPRSLRGEYFESMDQSVSFWLNRDGIAGPPRVVQRGDSTGYYYGPGAHGAEVAKWVIQEGGHTWPGGRFGVLGERFFGKITHDISANELMWKFFQQHPLQ